MVSTVEEKQLQDFEITFPEKYCKFHRNVIEDRCKEDEVGNRNETPTT